MPRTKRQIKRAHRTWTFSSPKSSSSKRSYNKTRKVHFKSSSSHGGIWRNISSK